MKSIYVRKFIGVLMDHKLNWKEHFKNLSNKHPKSIVILHNASHVLNSEALYISFCAIFLPYRNIWAEVWGNTSLIFLL